LEKGVEKDSIWEKKQNDPKYGMRKSVVSDKRDDVSKRSQVTV